MFYSWYIRAKKTASILPDRVLPRFNFLLYTLSEIRFSGTRNKLKIGLKASQTRFFFIFCQLFAIFDDFTKFNSAFMRTLHFEKSSNMTKIWSKNEKKALLSDRKREIVWKCRFTTQVKIFCEILELFGPYWRFWPKYLVTLV